MWGTRRYNAQYVKENRKYLATFDPENLTEDQEWEVEVISEHLDNRALFKPADLNYFELVFGADQHFQEIRCHYNGYGGSHKPILTEGYISFGFTEIQDLLSQDFKRLID